jgi:hypothetical protein
MDKKKELKEQYKNMKKDMGIFSIKNDSLKKVFIEGTNDLKGTMNGSLFKLDMNSHPNKELQKIWLEIGKDNFIVEIEDMVPHNDEFNDQMYKEELEIKKLIITEKYENEGYTMFKKSLISNK